MLERGRPELQWRAILAGVAGNVMEWYKLDPADAGEARIRWLGARRHP